MIKETFLLVGMLDLNMEYLYASIALCIAIVGGVTDITCGRVKNKHLVYTIACWACTLGIDLIIHKKIPANFLSIVLNMTLSATITAILYIKDIWAPGDGKLFLLISLIYPISLSPCLSGNVFPSLDIIIYAFAFAYIALLVSFLMRKDEASRKIIAVNVMKDFQWTRIVNIVANVGLVSIIDMGFQYVLPDFFISNRSLCLLCIIAVIYLANKKTPVIRNIIGFVGLCAFFTITHLNRIWLSMIITISQSFVISVIVEILNERIDKNNYRTIEGVDIKPGMILSHISVQDMQNCVDPALPRTTTETRRSRLTVSQAQAVRLWCKNAQRDVTIVEMLPFAPFIAVATIIHIVRFIVVYK